MSRGRVRRLKGKESLWIRIPGLVIGCAGLLLMPYLYFVDSASLVDVLLGMFICVIFASYGAGGSLLVFRIIPTTYVGLDIPPFIKDIPVYDEEDFDKTS